MATTKRKSAPPRGKGVSKVAPGPSLGFSVTPEMRHLGHFTQDKFLRLGHNTLPMDPKIGIPDPDPTGRESGVNPDPSGPPNDIGGYGGIPGLARKPKKIPKVLIQGVKDIGRNLAGIPKEFGRLFDKSKPTTRSLIDSGDNYRRAFQQRENARIKGAKAIYQDAAFAGKPGRRNANAFVRSYVSGKGDPVSLNRDGSFNFRTDTVANPSGVGVTQTPRRIALGQAAQDALNTIVARKAARRSRAGA